MVGAVLTGTLLGILTGLGIGGGSLLLLYLTFVKDLPPDLSRNISLLFFFPAASLSYFKKGQRIPFKKLMPAAAAGCLAAAAFSLLARVLDPRYFKKALGLLFIFTGLYELGVFRKRPH